MYYKFNVIKIRGVKFSHPPEKVELKVFNHLPRSSSSTSHLSHPSLWSHTPVLILRHFVRLTHGSCLDRVKGSISVILGGLRRYHTRVSTTSFPADPVTSL